MMLLGLHPRALVPQPLTSRFATARPGLAQMSPPYHPFLGLFISLWVIFVTFFNSWKDLRDGWG